MLIENGVSSAIARWGEQIESFVQACWPDLDKPGDELVLDCVVLHSIAPTKAKQLQLLVERSKHHTPCPHQVLKVFRYDMTE